jgi:hypothetical protein
MPPKAAALIRRVLRPRLYAIRVPAQDIRALLRCEEWRAWQSRNQQLLCVDGFPNDECGTALIVAAIGNSSRIEGSAVRRIRSKAQTKPKAAHRRLALTEDEVAGIVRLIREGNSSGNYFTQKKILNCVEVQIRKCLTHGLFDCFLHRNADILCHRSEARKVCARMQQRRRSEAARKKHLHGKGPTVVRDVAAECGVISLDTRRISERPPGWEPHSRGQSVAATTPIAEMLQPDG